MTNSDIEIINNALLTEISNIAIALTSICEEGHKNFKNRNDIVGNLNQLDAVGTAYINFSEYVRQEVY